MSGDDRVLAVVERMMKIVEGSSEAVTRSIEISMTQGQALGETLSVVRELHEHGQCMERRTEILRAMVRGLRLGYGSRANPLKTRPRSWAWRTR